MVSCVYPVKNVRDPTTAKAYACLQGVVFAEEMGFGEVIVEGDSMTIIKKLQSPKNDRSLIGVIINEIKEKKPEDLGALSFVTYHVEQTKWRTRWLHWGKDATP
ncbi:hypothetical protein PVK06_012253 [Gossypium arboreum]|uniref:RNase H type-1 domain-containing protein n=1 Tax=Gossypium arboreum TaxID=29729 RepID=A0ABR0QBT9_GOSAR|nr:hypothetical protein PVK06_012253 [Gossypium arboreum]